MQEQYISYVNQEHAWEWKDNLDDNSPFQLMVDFFANLFYGGGFKIINNLLILNGHESHITIKAFEQPTELRLD